MVFLSREKSDNIVSVDLGAFPQKTFWPFSTKLYNNKYVKEACSCLKYKYDLNTNLIMFCCWASVHDYEQLTVDDMAFISNKAIPWHAGVVEELKKVYTRLVNSPISKKLTHIIEKLLEDILMAEKVEQSIILQALQELKKPKNISMNKMDMALKNIFNYVHSQQALVHKTDLEKVYRIVTKCFAE